MFQTCLCIMAYVLIFSFCALALLPIHSTEAGLWQDAKCLYAKLQCKLAADNAYDNCIQRIPLNWDCAGDLLETINDCAKAYYECTKE